MAKSSMDRDAQKRLEMVVKFAGSNQDLVNEGLRRALRGVKDHARYTYLWNEVRRRALIKVRSAALKKGVGKPFRVTEGMRREARILAFRDNLPEDD